MHRIKIFNKEGDSYVCYVNVYWPDDSPRFSVVATAPVFAVNNKKSSVLVSATWEETKTKLETLGFKIKGGWYENRAKACGN